MKNLEKQIRNYIDECAIETLPITVTGFCVFLGISERELYEKYGDSIFIERLKTASKAHIINNGLSGAYNPAMAKLVLSSLGLEENQQSNKIEISFEGARL